MRPVTPPDLAESSQDQFAPDEPSAISHTIDHERRTAPRLSCKGFAEAIVSNEGILFRGEIRNLSRNGCFVRTQAHIPLLPLAPVELRFSAHGTQFSVHAEIASIKPSRGVSFHFLKTSPRTEADLTSLIQKFNS